MNFAQDYKKALKLACETIDKFSGSCPLDTYSCNLDCENLCESQSVECWVRYFLKKAKEKTNEY